MSRWTKMAGGAGVTAVLLAASACTASDDGDGDTETSVEARLVEMLNENRRLEAEAEAAEFRIIQQCLEDQGFTVHDDREMMTWTPAEDTTLYDSDPIGHFLPEADIAAEWGFGQWAYHPEAGDDAALDFERLGVDEPGRDVFDEVDSSAFEALSPQEQYDWYVAFLGEAGAQQHRDWIFEEEPGESQSEDRGDDGELVVADDVYEEPSPGGCQMEMIEAVYGGARQVTLEGGSADSVDSYVHWVYRPERPIADNTIEWVGDINAAYRARIADDEFDFLDCVSERGHGNWTFGEGGGLPIWEYWYLIYFGEALASDSDGQHPDPPADLPGDFEGLKALELQTAVDFAECGDDTGFREAATTAWEDVHEEYYLSIEVETYAWQEEMRTALETAQELIDA